MNEQDRKIEKNTDVILFATSFLRIFAHGRVSPSPPSSGHGSEKNNACLPCNHQEHVLAASGAEILGSFRLSMCAREVPHTWVVALTRKSKR